jgi:hypothetical protein
MGMNDELHFGNFSSSEIYRLAGSKKVRETYIAEKNIERRLGRVLRKDFTSWDMEWGHLIEYWGFGLLDMSYSLISDKTVRHPTVSYWVGSPDAINNLEVKAVGDIKGLQLKAFCEMVDAWHKGGIQAVRDNTDSGEKFYWQLVSNACLTSCKLAELILICPYESQLDDVRAAAIKYDGPDPGRFSRFAMAMNNQMAYLPDGGHYKNINIFQFDIPATDKCLIHDRVIEASKELVPFIKPVTV